MAPSRISRAAILDRALAVADSDGLAAVGVRRLARDLGVTPMALYWHVADKDALLDALADHLVARVDRTLDPALDWPEQLRSLLRSLLAVLRAHPGAAGLVGLRNSTSEASLELIETTLDVLARAGFSPANAVTIARQTLHATAALVAAQPRGRRAPIRAPWRCSPPCRPTGSGTSSRRPPRSRPAPIRMPPTRSASTCSSGASRHSRAVPHSWGDHRTDS